MSRLGLELCRPFSDKYFVLFSVFKMQFLCGSFLYFQFLKGAQKLHLNNLMDRLQRAPVRARQRPCSENSPKMKINDKEATNWSDRIMPCRRHDHQLRPPHYHLLCQQIQGPRLKMFARPSSLHGKSTRIGNADWWSNRAVRIRSRVIGFFKVCT